MDQTLPLNFYKITQPKVFRGEYLFKDQNDNPILTAKVVKFECAFTDLNGNNLGTIKMPRLFPIKELLFLSYTFELYSNNQLASLVKITKRFRTSIILQDINKKDIAYVQYKVDYQDSIYPVIIITDPTGIEIAKMTRNTQAQTITKKIETVAERNYDMTINPNNTIPIIILLELAITIIISSA